MRNLNSAVFGILLAIGACTSGSNEGSASSPGSEFIGHWKNLRNSKEFLTISRVEDSTFKVILESQTVSFFKSQEGERVNQTFTAIYREGRLDIRGDMGTIPVQYSKESDSLLMGSGEFVRYDGSSAQNPAPAPVQEPQSAAPSSTNPYLSEATVRSDLHNAATAMEVFYGRNGNTYVGATPQILRQNGYRPTPGVALEIAYAAPSNYKLVARAPSVGVWTFDNATGQIDREGSGSPSAQVPGLAPQDAARTLLVGIHGDWQNQWDKGDKLVISEESGATFVRQGVKKWRVYVSQGKVLVEENGRGIPYLDYKPGSDQLIFRGWFYKRG